MLKTISHSDAAEILALLGISCGSGQSMEVDESIRVRGLISKGADTEAVATVKTLSLATVGCILRHCGVTRERAIENALRAVTESGAVTPADAEFAEDFKRAVAEKLPKIPVSGRRTGKLIVEPLGGYAATQFKLPENNSIPALTSAS